MVTQQGATGLSGQTPRCCPSSWQEEHEGTKACQLFGVACTSCCANKQPQGHQDGRFHRNTLGAAASSTHLTSIWIKHPSCRDCQGSKHAVQDVAQSLWSSNHGSSQAAQQELPNAQKGMISKAVITLAFKKSVGEGHSASLSTRQNLTFFLHHSEGGSQARGQHGPHLRSPHAKSKLSSSQPCRLVK